MWLQKQKEEGKSLEKVDSFVIINEDMMEDYEKFASGISLEDRSMFPSNSAIRFFLKQHGHPVIEVIRFNTKFISLPPGNIIDDMCEWVVQSREDISLGQFHV